MKQKKETGGFKKNFSFQFNGKKMRVPVIVCNTFFSQAKGLMFSRGFNALLFTFDHKTNKSIHSFFCPDFIVIYFDGDRIIDLKSITKLSFSIRPLASYTHFLEIPVGNSAYHLILDGMRKI